MPTSFPTVKPTADPPPGKVWFYNEDLNDGNGGWVLVDGPAAPTQNLKVTSTGTWTRLNDPAGKTQTEYEVSLQPDGTMMYRIKGEGDTAWRDRTTFWKESWVDLNKPAAPVTPTPPASSTSASAFTPKAAVGIPAPGTASAAPRTTPAVYQGNVPAPAASQIPGAQPSSWSKRPGKDVGGTKKPRFSWKLPKPRV
jgi:hypothetical protein